mgnify:CR=1 FL=1
MNNIRLIGNQGKDPGMRVTQWGQGKVRFSLACSRSWKTPEGEAREETDWFNITASGNLGKICNEYLHKGSKVYIEGRVSVHQYDDPQTGQKKTWVDVIAHDMMMLDSRQAGEGGSYGGGQRSSTAERPASNQDTSVVPVFEEDMDDIPF